MLPMYSSIEQERSKREFVQIVFLGQLLFQGPGCVRVSEEGGISNISLQLLTKNLKKRINMASLLTA